MNPLTEKRIATQNELRGIIREYLAPVWEHNVDRRMVNEKLGIIDQVITRLVEQAQDEVMGDGTFLDPNEMRALIHLGRALPDDTEIDSARHARGAYHGPTPVLTVSVTHPDDHGVYRLMYAGEALSAVTDDSGNDMWEFTSEDGVSS